MDFLEGLNPQQREAAAHIDGPLLILAGAGSGKTRVITHRIANLITAHGVPAWAILAVTFTNKAAGEMRDRVRNLLSKAGASGAPTVSTFHSFCVRLLRRDGDRLADIRPGFTREFTIYDDDDQLAVVKQVFKAIGLDEKFMQYRAALSLISNAKNSHQTPQEFYASAKDPKMSRMAVVYEKYSDRLRAANALDFDDLLLESVRLLRHDANVREAYGRRIQYLLIDEYQDTNRSQYDLMRLLTTMHQNVCVVGDEDQSIYGWRGADIRNILDFERDFPNAKVIRLEQNYRSTKTILEAASKVVANNEQRKGKWLWTDSGQGDPVVFYEAPDGENEALFIADSLDKILRQHPDWRVAVLYRTNFQSRQIEEALRRYGRKYTVVGGFSFYQRAEVKDLLAYLKVVLSPQDTISLLRVINNPARGIGKTTTEQIEVYALQNNLSFWDAMAAMSGTSAFGTRAESSLKAFRAMIEELRTDFARPVDQLLRLILDRTGYLRMLENDPNPDARTRMENLEELVNAAAEAVEREETAADFLDHAALISDADDIDEGAQISLLTMHNAKGLEFPVVFIAGMEENLFPHSRSRDNPAQLEEERRLCYVAMTRAEKRLYMTWAKSRRRWGGGSPEPAIPSRFLSEVPRELVEAIGSRAKAAQVELYSEQSYVNQAARRNLYTGKTYNSLENIAQFFADRGIKPPSGGPPPSGTGAPRPPVAGTTNVYPPRAGSPVKPGTQAASSAPRRKAFGPGSRIQHPKYGRGTVMRREGDGDDAKLTVSFPGYGLKKLVEKYAGIKIEE
jgi:DNA helicase II / ATP-dependent DNA helicase PcrA